ncbi:hypothetical protein SETIT_4G117900v2 [Setaria italica]|uniref:Ubiquitin-like protease family profile domain-containing protein n=1 Tax=Setaria italica TaxID=4555 RepID=A0A368QT84_SETIT|nr:hypothetical protein SETIT_4G117900v2 [Setaria italica]
MICTWHYAITTGFNLPATRGTYVLSQDPYQKRKKIMSPWVELRMMSDGMYNKFVEKAFDFLNADYNMILFPIHQSNENEPKGDGHWFTIVVNMEAKKFQVIDSLRAPSNAELRDKANKVRAKVITLWKKYTAKHMGCTVPTIYLFELEFITGFKQWNAMQCWDGSRLPKLIGYGEFKLRKDMLFEWINSPTNKIDWRNCLLSKMKSKNMGT